MLREPHEVLPVELAEVVVEARILGHEGVGVVDSVGAKRAGARKLVPVATVKGGRIYGSASIPVVHADG